MVSHDSAVGVALADALAVALGVDDALDDALGDVGVVGSVDAPPQAAIATPTEIARRGMSFRMGAVCSTFVMRVATHRLPRYNQCHMTVAGTFYPGDSRMLAADVDAMLAAVPHDAATPPKALIVPHAGFVYSGPIAATAYARVRGADISRVVLIGPAHRVFLKGMAAPSGETVCTPLGEMRIDRASLERAGVPSNDAAHREEHSLEVQLPFLQRVAPHAEVCPIAIGRAEPSEVARVIEALWGGPETLVVVSTDLSHYLPYAEGREADERTAEKFVALDDDLTGDDACGFVGVRGLLVLARRKKLACKLLDLRSSGDTAGSKRAEVVGYGAFALWEAS